MFNELLGQLARALRELGMEVYDGEREDDDLELFVYDRDDIEFAMVLTLIAMQEV